MHLLLAVQAKILFSPLWIDCKKLQWLYFIRKLQLYLWKGQNSRSSKWLSLGQYQYGDSEDQDSG